MRIPFDLLAGVAGLILLEKLPGEVIDKFADLLVTPLILALVVID